MTNTDRQRVRRAIRAAVDSQERPTTASVSRTVAGTTNAVENEVFDELARMWENGLVDITTDDGDKVVTFR